MADIARAEWLGGSTVSLPGALQESGRIGDRSHLPLFFRRTISCITPTKFALRPSNSFATPRSKRH